MAGGATTRHHQGQENPPAPQAAVADADQDLPHDAAVAWLKGLALLGADRLEMNLQIATWSR
jgi:hypothetical protein